MADWCGPCKRVGPLVATLAARASVPLEVVNVDTDPDFADRYGVRAVPHFVLEDEYGAIVYTGSGAESIPRLRDALEAL